MDGAMRTRWWLVALIFSLLGVIEPSSSRDDLPDQQPFHDPDPTTMHPPCLEDEGWALLAIKAELSDPHHVLHDWFVDAAGPCPCHWRKAVACVAGHVTHLKLVGLGMSGTLSPRIADLTSLQMLLLPGNAISFPALALQYNSIFGPIPDSIGRLLMLRLLDMSSNSLNGSIPSSLGDLKNLDLLMLNNNSLTGVVPDSLGTIDSLDILDLSYNNLSSPLADMSAGYFDVTGNPLICGVNGHNCFHDRKSRPHHGMVKLQRVVVIFAAAVGSVVLSTVAGMLLWGRYTRTRKILPLTST